MTTEAEAQKRLEEFKEAAAKGEVEIKATDEEIHEVMETFKSGREIDFTVTRAEISGVWSYNGGQGFEISWGTKSAGFGTITFTTDEKGNTRIDNEGMDIEFCGNVLLKLLENAFKQKEKDTEKSDKE
jgi:hypothetical protein